MTSQTETSSRNTLPMPLFLQGIVEAFVAAFLSALVIVVPLAGVWIAGGFSAMPLEALAVLGGQIWMLNHAVPTELNLEISSELTMTGTWWFLPLGWLIVPIFLGRRAGIRLAKASKINHVWKSVAGVAAGYIGFCTGTVAIVTTETVAPNPTLGVVFPVLIFGIGLAWGVLGHYRPEWAEWGLADKFSQRTRWSLAYLFAAIKAGAVGVLSVIALAAILLAVHVFVHWAAITEVYQRVGAGIWGGTVMTLGQMLLVPTLVLWVVAFSTGMGFTVGEGSLITPAGSVVGAQPGIPIFAALPAETTLAHTWWVLLLPLAAGVIAGWFFVREGEDHLGEWLAVKIENPTVASILASVLNGIVVGASAVAAGYLIQLLSSGSWAFGKFHDLGPTPMAGLVLGGIIGVGTMIGYALAPFLRRRA